MDDTNLFLVAKAAIVGVAGAFSAAFGWMGWLIVAWVVCMVADYLSGSAAAMKSGTWASATARAGIWHKAGMIAVVAVAAMADGVLGTVLDQLPSLPIQYSVLVLPMVLVWYILTELGSILENATAMGAPVPAFLIQILKSAKDKVEDVAADDTEIKS